VIVESAPTDGRTAAPAALIEQKEHHMPFINVKLIKDVFDDDQKSEMIEKLTETMVGIEGEAMRHVTWVTVEEVDSGAWGIGGNVLTTQAVKDLKAGGGTS